MFKYVVAALAAGAEAQSRFRGRRRRNRRFSVDQTLYTGPPAIAAGATEYARAVYVPRKAYGTFADPKNKEAVQINEGVRGVIIAESIDGTALTASTTSDVYTYFSNLGHPDITTYQVGVQSAANLKLWKCTWDLLETVVANAALAAVPVVASTNAGFSTRSGIMYREDGAGFKKHPGISMDIKTNVADSAASAGNGRRAFRGSLWRKTGSSSMAVAAAGTTASSINYVVEVTGQDLTSANTERIGCGVFRPYNEESAKKRIEDIFLPLGDYAAASATNTSGILEEMQNN